jgi:hypothetical protein
MIPVMLPSHERKFADPSFFSARMAERNLTIAALVKQ